jgi:hypothetical protein
MSEERLLTTSADWVWANWTPPTLEELSARWGGWRLEGLMLCYPAYPAYPGLYPVDVERFTTSAQVLDMIMQVAKKRWADDECLAGLVRALNDILEPQANLCSFGSDKKLTRAKIRRLVKREG